LKKRIYICGPMTGYPDHNFPAFDRAKLMLEERGWDTVSPADIDRSMGITERSTPEETAAILPAMQLADTNAIHTCKAIYCLKGWEFSSGAQAEHALARWLRLEFYYEGGI
jgi:hypothetical protein